MSQQRPGSWSGARQAVEAWDLEPEADTTGHSSLAYEFGATVARERQRQAERAARDLGRLAQRPRRSLLDRIRGRLPSRWAATRVTVALDDQEPRLGAHRATDRAPVA